MDQSLEAIVRRLMKCEERTERYLALIQELQREMRALQQSLREQRGTV